MVSVTMWGMGSLVKYPVTVNREPIGALFMVANLISLQPKEKIMAAKSSVEWGKLIFIRQKVWFNLCQISVKLSTKVTDAPQLSMLLIKLFLRLSSYAKK